MKHIAVLLTVHNRKEKTLRCLQDLFAQDPVDGYAIDIWLTRRRLYRWYCRSHCRTLSRSTYRSGRWESVLEPGYVHSLASCCNILRL